MLPYRHIPTHCLPDTLNRQESVRNERNELFFRHRENQAKKRKDRVYRFLSAWGYLFENVTAVRVKGAYMKRNILTVLACLLFGRQAPPLPHPLRQHARSQP